MRGSSIFGKGAVVAAVALFGCLAVPGAWRQQQSGTLAWLRSVYFADAENGWVVGSKGTLLVTDDGGRHWRRAEKITTDNIWDVYFSDPRNGWLLCESDIYNGGGPHSYLLHTSDGMKTWERTDLTGSNDRIVRFFFDADGRGSAVGQGGSIWRTLDDKMTWERKSLPSRLLMLDGTFLDPLKAVLVGGGGKILVTADGGAGWRDAVVPVSASVRLNAVYFVDKTRGWTAGAQGKILASENGGKTWSEQATGVPEDLSDIFFVNPREGFAVGDRGRILATTTAGTTWTAADAGIRSKLERVVFAGGKGYAVGFGGVILAY